jgi:predicted transcriptional regulator
MPILLQLIFKLKRGKQMTATVQHDNNLWKQFSGLAQQKRKRPDRLLERLIAEYLAVQKDLQLDETIRQQARKSGLKESDAVEVVKRYRQTKRA